MQTSTFGSKSFASFKKKVHLVPIHDAQTGGGGARAPCIYASLIYLAL